MDALNIRFVKGHGNASGSVSGRLEALGQPAGAVNFLGELSDVHPAFAERVVAAVNTYAALQKVLAAQGPSGPLALALRGVL